MLSGHGEQPKPASPYGDLIFDGFATGAGTQTPQNFAGLRGSAP
jgi:hypothetical protein